MQHTHDHTTAWGTLTGTIFTVLSTIDSTDIIKTVVMAIIGASVSFCMSLFWKWVWRFVRAPHEPKKNDLLKLFECPWETEGIFYILKKRTLVVIILLNGLQRPEGGAFTKKLDLKNLCLINHKTVFGTRNTAFWVAAVIACG